MQTPYSSIRVGGLAVYICTARRPIPDVCTTRPCHARLNSRQIISHRFARTRVPRNSGHTLTSTPWLAFDNHVLNAHLYWVSKATRKNALIIQMLSVIVSGILMRVLKASAFTNIIMYLSRIMQNMNTCVCNHATWLLTYNCVPLLPCTR